MTYFAPKVTSAGLSIPTFDDMQQVLIDAYRACYGATTYLGNDSADYQWITALTLKLNDNMSLCQLEYNQRSPLTAIGSGLDSIIKLNGIARKVPTFSTAILVLSGAPGTPINNAVVADINGVLWILPATVTIGPGGTVGAIGTAQQSGAISADPNTIKFPVGGFTAGWTGVTNPSAAIPGDIPEADSQLRARQGISVALPSLTRLAGTIADLLATPGVTRINVIENQTNVTDPFGNTGHSITCVVEGGTDLAVATSIYNNKGIGCNTDAATATAMTTVNVTDPNSGNITPISFIRPSYVPIYISLSVHGITSAFNSAMQDDIVNALAAYLNGLKIGEAVIFNALMAVAMSVNKSLLSPDYKVTVMTTGIAPSPVGTTDIVLNFWETAQGIVPNIILTVV